MSMSKFVSIPVYYLTTCVPNRSALEVAEIFPYYAGIMLYAFQPFMLSSIILYALHERLAAPDYITLNKVEIGKNLANCGR